MSNEERCCLKPSFELNLRKKLFLKNIKSLRLREGSEQERKVCIAQLVPKTHMGNSQNPCGFSPHDIKKKSTSSTFSRVETFRYMSQMSLVTIESIHPHCEGRG